MDVALGCVVCEKASARYILAGFSVCEECKVNVAGALASGYVAASWSHDVTRVLAYALAGLELRNKKK